MHIHAFSVCFVSSVVEVARIIEERNALTRQINGISKLKIPISNYYNGIEKQPRKEKTGTRMGSDRSGDSNRGVVVAQDRDGIAVGDAVEEVDKEDTVAWNIPQLVA